MILIDTQGSCAHTTLCRFVQLWLFNPWRFPSYIVLVSGLTTSYFCRSCQPVIPKILIKQENDCGILKAVSIFDSHGNSSSLVGITFHKALQSKHDLRPPPVSKLKCCASDLSFTKWLRLDVPNQQSERRWLNNPSRRQRNQTLSTWQLLGFLCLEQLKAVKFFFGSKNLVPKGTVTHDTNGL